MRCAFRGFAFLALSLICFVVAASAQVGNSGSIEGVVKDPSGAAVVNVGVEIKDPVSGYKRTTTTSNEGAFRFTNVPFNGYHLSVNATGFAPFAQDLEVRSMVPTKIEVDVKIVTAATTVTVESGGDLTENDPTFHTDVDRNDFERLPLESASSSVSSQVTLVTPGVAADSTGFSTDSVIMRKTLSPLTVNRSRTNRARFFPTKSLPPQSSLSKSFLVRRPRNLAIRPVW